MMTPIDAWFAHVERLRYHGYHPAFSDQLDTQAVSDAVWLTPAPGERRPVSWLEDRLTRPDPPSDDMRWLVLGRPGCGKTSLARALASSIAASRGPTVPIYLLARELLQPTLHPFDAAERALRAFRGRQSSEGLSHALDESAADGRVLLLLDGLDEIDPSAIVVLRDLTRAWLEQHAGLRIALFARSPAADSIDPRFRRVHIAPLDGDAIRALLRQWLHDLPDEPVERAHLPWYIDQLDSPLLVSALALHMRAGRVPERAAVFGTAITTLLQRIPDPTRVDALRSLLSDLSVDLMARPDVTRTTDRMREWLAALIDRTPLHRRGFGSSHRPARLLEEIATRTAILAPAVAPDDEWRYLHAPLVERLAAETIAALGPAAIAERAERIRRDDPRPERWASTLGMACALCPDAMRALEYLRVADARLAVLALPEVSRLTARQVFDFLYAIPITRHEGDRWVDLWNGDTLLCLARAWSDPIAVLWAELTSDRTLDQAACMHYALESLIGKPLERERFFGRWTRMQPTELAPDRLVALPKGHFTMGSTIEEIGRFFGSGDDWPTRLMTERELPGHVVEVKRPFRMGRTPVTLAEYRHFDSNHSVDGPEDLPVTGVSWWAARLYCAWVGGRLPSEAEWEFACRAGTRTAFWCGDDPDRLGEVAWYSQNSDGSPQPVGKKRANAWGLSDMHGNVWEWCSDNWSLYGRSDQRASEARAARGGAFDEDARWIRSACRSKAVPAMRDIHLGFRVVADSQT